MYRSLIALLLLLLAYPVGAKEVTSEVRFTHDCATVDDPVGEASLDTDSDLSVCELLTGFRIYDQDGNYLGGIPEDGTRSITVSRNAPVWTESCIRLTAVMDDLFNPGVVLESDLSNAGGCVPVRPGKPNSPKTTN